MSHGAPVAGPDAALLGLPADYSLRPACLAHCRLVSDQARDFALGSLETLATLAFCPFRCVCVWVGG